MKLASLLSPEQVILEMSAAEHWSAIEELVAHLIEIGRLEESRRQEVLGMLRAREELVSTGVGYGVAIPHALCDQVQNVIAVFGRSAQGIDFESLDGQPVHFVILFLVPKKDYHLHLQTLAAIAKMFTNSEMRQKLADADTREEILHLFGAKPSRPLPAGE